MYFSILGPLEVSEGDVHLPVRRGRPRSVLHLLIVNRRVVVPTEVLADRLWPDEPPQDVPNAVHQLLSYLRRALGTEGRGVLSTTPSGYVLNVPDDAVDAWQFDRYVTHALDLSSQPDAAALARACVAADNAIKLWRGDPFAESAHLEWSAGARARLQDGYVQAQLSRLDAMLRLGRHREVVLDAQALAAAYPLREDFHHHHALALYRSGRQSEALETLRDVRALLARELGVDPGRRLQELEQDVLRQSDVLEWTPPRGHAAIIATPQAVSPQLRRSVESAESRWSLPTPPPITTPTTTLVGRDQEIETVAALGSPGALVTITGPAGVGKTRLLLAVAVQSPRPVWYVDLTAATKDDDVALIIAQALDPSFSGAEPLPVLAAGLDEVGAIVVLDGCEHVTDGVRQALAVLRRVGTGATFLLGSRRPTDLQQEQVHRLSPLPVPGTTVLDDDELLNVEAVRLFSDRARLARAAYEPTRQDAELIGNIVTAVDGLPLAIELAASLLDVDTPAAVLKRLEGQLGSMPHARFSLPTRERTLAAAIDASVSAASPEERDLLAALGVFAGQFDVEGAAAVADIEADQTYSQLVALTRQSLMVSIGDGRFQLLAPVRSWARTTAAASLDVAGVKERHATYMCGKVWTTWEQGGGLRHRGALRGLATVLPDARAALEWALEHHDVACSVKIAVACSWVWTLSGHGEDGLRELLRVKDLMDAQPLMDPEASQLRASLLRSIGLVANPVGNLELAAEVCAEAADLHLRLGDNEQAAAALLTLGIARWARGEFSESRHALQAARDLTTKCTTSWHHVAARVLLARTLLDEGVPEADSSLDTALRFAQTAGDPHLHGLALACRSRWFLVQEDAVTSEMAAREALRLWRTINYLEGEMMALNLLSRSSLMSGEPETARSHALQALMLAQPANHRGGMCEAVESLALAMAAQGRREQALLLLDVAARERARIGAPVPAADRRTVESCRVSLETALGQAAKFVTARASLSGFDDIAARTLDDPAAL